MREVIHRVHPPSGTCTTSSWWVRDRPGARWPGGSPRGPRGRVLLLEAGQPARCRSWRDVASLAATAPGPPAQLGASGRAAPRHARRGPARAGARRVGRDQRRGLDARHPRRRRGLGPARLAYADAARTAYADRRTRDRRSHAADGPVPVLVPPGRCCTRAAERFLAAAETWASRPSRTRTRAARPARGWCRATPSTACGSTRPAPTCPRRAPAGRAADHGAARAPPCAPTRPSSGCWSSTAARSASSSRDGERIPRGRGGAGRGRRRHPAILLLRSGIGPADDAARRGHRRPARPARRRPRLVRPPGRVPAVQHRRPAAAPARPHRQAALNWTRAPTRRATSRCCCSPARSSPAATCT